MKERLKAPELRFDGFADKPRVAQKQYPRIGADKRRRHAAQNNDNLQKAAALYVIHIIHIGQGHADDQRDDCGHHRYLERIPQCGKVIAFAEKLL